MLIVLFVLCVKILYANNNNAGLRTGIKLKKEFSDRFEAGIEFQYRRKNNFITFDKTFFEPSLLYHINKGWRLGVNYRFIADQNLYYRINYKHRANLSLRYKTDFLTDFTLKLKTALQYGFDDIAEIYPDVYSKLVNRNMVEVGYDIFGTTLSPVVNYEMFYHLNNPEGGIIYQWRTGAGLSYKISKMMKLAGMYYYNNQIVQPDLNSNHIFEVICSLKF